MEQNKIYKKKKNNEKRENNFCVCHNKERVQRPARENERLTAIEKKRYQCAVCELLNIIGQNQR